MKRTGVQFSLRPPEIGLQDDIEQMQNRAAAGRFITRNYIYEPVKIGISPKGGGTVQSNCYSKV